MTENESLSVNINEASEDELIAIRGIGKNLAQRIINKRPYNELHDLVNISGINELKLASLLPYLTLMSPEKITPSAEATRDEEDVINHEKMVETEAFLFLEDQKDLENAFLIVFGGFIIGLIILLLRRRCR